MNNAKRYFVLILFCFIYNALLALPQTQRVINFDDGWLFQRGAALGGERPEYNDQQWRKLDLPHDWSIEDIPHTNSPFDIGAINQVNGGFTVGGTGWYRKHFTVPASHKPKRWIIQFDGVYMNSDVWLNGKRLGIHPYGYTSFWFDMTDQVKLGAENIIAVRVRNEGENSRWYSGSGIYRHVWLKSVEPLHIAQWGVSVTTENITDKSAVLKLQYKVQNQDSLRQEFRLVTKILDPNGEEIRHVESKENIDGNIISGYNNDLSINHSGLWSMDDPKLYTLKLYLLQYGEPIDSSETKFGIRSITFDANNGFRLNGKTTKLKGGCIHHDNGPLGAKAYDRAEERKIQILKDAGYNAIRTSHNPPSPALLDACDRLGMLVIDEAFDCWEDKKNAFDYHLYFKEWWQKDIESMLLRDRDHPSIIMWSTGNEIPNRDKPNVVAVAKKLADYIKTFDNTRPITCGVNGVEENKDAFFATLDVAGYNYALDKYASDHQRLPNRVMYGTESYPSQSFEYWMGVKDNPSVIGDFVWTAWDYIGEASIGWLGYPQRQFFYPWNLAFCGDIDVCGWKRPQSFYRDALWKTDQLSVFVTPPKPSFDTANFTKEVWAHWEWEDAVSNWNWKGYENKIIEVSIYSSCEEVELFLNNKSLGKQKTDRSNKFMARFNVPYQPGVLKAVGYKQGKPITTSVIKTAGSVSQLVLKADRQTIQADGQDLSYVTVEMTDKNGVVNPLASNLIKFSVTGPATIIAVGNADPTSVESCTQPQRKAWRGKCLVIIKADKKAGQVIVKATANGLPISQTTIQCK